MEAQIEDVCCPVCMNTFHRPTTISCGHTFCLSCLLNATRNQRSCPICRQHFSSTPSKIKPDITLTTFLQALKNTQKKQQQQHKPENIHVQCKQQRLLLLDITTEDLLLPFNRVSATFELQNACLIDRLDRFVARQEQPFNSNFAIIRSMESYLGQFILNRQESTYIKESFRGEAFAGSRVKQSIARYDFFYRSCGSRQISESSDASPAQYNIFFSYFSKIKKGEIKQQLYKKIDPSIFSHKNDPIALFYSILGVLNMSKQAKYQVATSFDEERRIQQIQKLISSRSTSLERNPTSLVRVSTEGGDLWPWMMLGLVLMLLWMSREGLLQDL